MEIWIAVVAVVVLLAVAAAVFVLLRRRRTGRLSERFGPEYERAVHEHGDQRAAELDLQERMDRRDELDLRALSPAERRRYSETWHGIQTRFVDEPEPALEEADALIAEVMVRRGYPVDRFEEQERLLSVDHPEIMSNYRKGHDIYLRCTAGDATTEELREGMLAYRSLFSELVDETETTRTKEAR